MNLLSLNNYNIIKLRTLWSGYSTTAFLKEKFKQYLANKYFEAEGWLSHYNCIIMY